MPHVADKDIHVYKICLRKYKESLLYENDGALPYYQFAKVYYEEGNTYNADHFDEPCRAYYDRVYEIHHGMHSYSCKNKLIQGAKTNWVNLILVDSFDAHTAPTHYDIKLNLVLVLCSIPKGTTYFLNERGEYVSESIRIDKFLVLTENAIDTLNEELKEWNNE